MAIDDKMGGNWKKVMAETSSIYDDPEKALLISRSLKFMISKH